MQEYYLHPGIRMPFDWMLEQLTNFIHSYEPEDVVPLFESAFGVDAEICVEDTRADDAVCFTPGDQYFGAFDRVFEEKRTPWWVPAKCMCIDHVGWCPVVLLNAYGSDAEWVCPQCGTSMNQVSFPALAGNPKIDRRGEHRMGVSILGTDVSIWGPFRGRLMLSSPAQDGTMTYETQPLALATRQCDEMLWRQLDRHARAVYRDLKERGLIHGAYHDVAL